MLPVTVQFLIAMLAYALNERVALRASTYFSPQSASL